MVTSTSHSCANGSETLVFACSGAADVGEIADRAARQVARDRVANMFCLAGVGGRVPAILERTRGAQKIIAIDGCDKECAKHCLLSAGFTSFKHLRVTSLGFEKGKTSVSQDNIEKVSSQASQI